MAFLRRLTSTGVVGRVFLLHLKLNAKLNLLRKQYWKKNSFIYKVIYYDI